MAFVDLKDAFYGFYQQAGPELLDVLMDWIGHLY